MTFASASATLLGVALLVAPVSAAGAANKEQSAILATYVAAAKLEPGFAEPSAERGRAFFFAAHAGGKAETPACTSCHGTNLAGPGQTKAGKAIEPMAASVVPSRYTDPENVEKWFKRNCQDTLGRACSAGEKADVLTFLFGL